MTLTHKLALSFFAHFVVLVSWKLIIHQLKLAHTSSFFRESFLLPLH